MVNNAKLTRLKAGDIKNQAMDGLYKIYNESINISEQKPRWLLEEMLASSNYYFYALSLKEKVIGFAIAYAPADKDYYLLEYMAIDSNLRSGGYGGKIFDELATIFSGKTMVIEIDSPYEDSEDKAIRQKRMEFYMRHNSRLVQGLSYILPIEAPHIPAMLILLHSCIYKDSILKEKLLLWLTDIYINVYGCKAEDKRLDIMFNNIPDNIPLS